MLPRYTTIPNKVAVPTLVVSQNTMFTTTLIHISTMTESKHSTATVVVNHFQDCAFTSTDNTFGRQRSSSSNTCAFTKHNVHNHIDPHCNNDRIKTQPWLLQNTWLVLHLLMKKNNLGVTTTMFSRLVLFFLSWQICSKGILTQVTVNNNTHWHNTLWSFSFWLVTAAAARTTL